MVKIVAAATLLLATVSGTSAEISISGNDFSGPNGISFATTAGKSPNDAFSSKYNVGIEQWGLNVQSWHMMGSNLTAEYLPQYARATQGSTFMSWVSWQIYGMDKTPFDDPRPAPYGTDNVNAARIATLKAATDEWMPNGCEVYMSDADNYFPLCGHPDDTAEEIAEALALREWEIETAKALGCKAVRWNTKWKGGALTAAGVIDDPAGAADICPNYKTLVDGACKTHGLDCLIENHGGMSSEPKFLTKLMADAGAPNSAAGVHYDSGNYGGINSASYPQFEGSVYENLFKPLLPYIKKFSAKCHGVDRARNECYGMDFSRMFRDLKNAGHDLKTLPIGVETEGCGEYSAGWAPHITKTCPVWDSDYYHNFGSVIDDDTTSGGWSDTYSSKPRGMKSAMRAMNQAGGNGITRAHVFKALAEADSDLPLAPERAPLIDPRARTRSRTADHAAVAKCEQGLMDCPGFPVTLPRKA
jgi:hypothetical protein